MNYLRKKLKTNKQNICSCEQLPTGYIKVNYLETNSNNQNITMLPLKKNDIVEIISSTRNSANYRTILGNKFGAYELYFNNYKVYVYGSNITLLSDKVIDSDLKIHISTIRTNLAIAPILFAYQTNGNYPLEGKIYSCKATRNGELVQNLVPCLDENRIACFYDTISKTTLYNSNPNKANFLYG